MKAPATKKFNFFWTMRHFENPTAVTLVSARNSGASYLNRVELQNGCLALGHANLFIPSTLGGSCVDDKTGKVHPTKYERTMRLASEVYINRVKGCPCGDSTISLFERSGFW